MITTRQRKQSHNVSSVAIPRTDLFQKSEIEQSIVRRFEQQVTERGEAIAIQSASQVISYRALNQRANLLARRLVANGQPKKSEPVVIFLEQGQDSITALLAVLKSGKFYIPVDPNFPQSRNAYIVQNSQAQLIITSAEHLSVVQTLADDDCKVFTIEQVKEPDSSSEASAIPSSKNNLNLDISPDQIANVIYTSGSTGRPKGVVQNHRNLLHNCRNYTNPMQITASDRMVLLHSCSVMGAVNGIFNALLNGATIFPFDVKQAGLAALANLLVEEEITIYYSVVTLFRHFANFLATDDVYKNCRFEHLRLIRLGGEAVSKRDLSLYQNQFSDRCRLYLGLGSTETGGIKLLVADKTTTIRGDKLPLGESLDDMTVRLLDASGQDACPGEIGEICVQSPYIALGYWQDPQRTNAAFLPDPEGGDRRIYRTGDLGQYCPDGTLLHCGRKDFQLKVRGYRVEIGEIESVLQQEESVKEVAVKSDRDAIGETRLVAYIVSKKTFDDESLKSIWLRALRHYAQSHLPQYMVPSVFIRLEALPLTPNGKVNRMALPAPEPTDLNGSVAFVAPRTQVEQQILQVWTQVLGIEKIGINDNFFELGGHSLIATQIVARLKSLHQMSLPVTALFKSPTVADLAAIIERSCSEADSAEETSPIEELPSIQSLQEQQDPSPIPFSFAQQRLWLIQQLEPESHAYH